MAGAAMATPSPMRRADHRSLYGFLYLKMHSSAACFHCSATLAECWQANPELAHILNDPATLRQSLETARNPQLMREMMRSTDRAMSNIESHPEVPQRPRNCIAHAPCCFLHDTTLHRILQGFNALRRMYSNIQQPLYETMQDSRGFGSPSAEGNSSNPSTSSPPQPASPNTAALPNPWARPAPQQQVCALTDETPAVDGKCTHHCSPTPSGRAPRYPSHPRARFGVLVDSAKAFTKAFTNAFTKAFTKAFTNACTPALTALVTTNPT